LDFFNFEVHFIKLNAMLMEKLTQIRLAILEIANT